MEFYNNKSCEGIISCSGQTLIALPKMLLAWTVWLEGINEIEIKNRYENKFFFLVGWMKKTKKKYIFSRV